MLIVADIFNGALGKDLKEVNPFAVLQSIDQTDQKFIQQTTSQASKAVNDVSKVVTVLSAIGWILNFIIKR